MLPTYGLRTWAHLYERYGYLIEKIETCLIEEMDHIDHALSLLSGGIASEVRASVHCLLVR